MLYVLFTRAFYSDFSRNIMLKLIKKTLLVTLLIKVISRMKSSIYESRVIPMALLSHSSGVSGSVPSSQFIVRTEFHVLRVREGFLRVLWCPPTSQDVSLNEFTLISKLNYTQM